MLLTAVTDFDSGGKRQSHMVSAVRGPSDADSASALSLFSRLTTPAPSETPFNRKLDPQLRPNTARVFVPHDADPVMARREAELDERANRGKPINRNRLKWDEDGWYREEVALITAYCPCPKCCGTQSPGITSIGKDAWTPGLAADPIYLPYGTKVFVPGYGLSVIDDTGGAMRRHWRRNGLLHIDVRMTYHYEARQWGKQYLRVKIYDEE